MMDIWGLLFGKKLPATGSITPEQVRQVERQTGMVFQRPMVNGKVQDYTSNGMIAPPIPARKPANLKRPAATTVQPVNKKPASTPTAPAQNMAYASPAGSGADAPAAAGGNNTLVLAGLAAAGVFLLVK